MTRLSSVSIACAAALVTLTSGCTTALVQTENANIENALSSSDRMLENARTGTPLERNVKPMVNVHQTAWIPAKKITPDDMKPGFEQGRRDISINRDFRDIQDVAERITLLTGLPVSIASDVTAAGASAEPASSASSASSGSTGASTGPMTPTPVPMPPTMGGSPTSMSMNDLFNMPGLSGININYSGPLSGFLDVAASRFNIAWRWNEDGRSIEFYRFETRTFRITALPGDTTLNSSISPTNNTGATGGAAGGAGSSGGGGGGSEQTTTVSFSGLSVWSAMEKSIQTMVGASGKVVSSPALGTITVTDTPSVLKKVAEFVNKQNAALGKQVVVNVKVLSVDVSNSKSYGVNWDAVYKSLSKDYGLSFSTSFVPTLAGTSDLSLNVISSGENARWSGTSAMIRALSSQGKVSQVTSAAVTTLNNQPVPVNVGRQIAYLASSTTTTTDNSGTSTSLQPGMINTGFSMNLVPHIQDGDQLLLQYAIDLSALKSIYTVTSGDSSIQTPEIESRKFMQRVKLNSGDTLVVAGFEQANTDTDQSGIGSAANALFGGGVNSSRDRNALVILIQPVVVDY